MYIACVTKEPSLGPWFLVSWPFGHLSKEKVTVVISWTIANKCVPVLLPHSCMENIAFHSNNYDGDTIILLDI